MSRPIVIAHHLIWTAYGWWLPNDPRGSSSNFVSSDVIFELGNLHHGRKKVQPKSSTIREFYVTAQGKLKHALLPFGRDEIAVIAEAISQVVEKQRYTCYACALMPDHVHMVIRKHKHSAEEMIRYVQMETREALLRSGLREDAHPVWGGPGWKVFLDTPDDVRRTIHYVEVNPIKIGKPRQKWGFVKAYDGWPLHPGSSPNSPYAKRLRGQS
jgi:REP-associated tyrosine transposase